MRKKVFFLTLIWVVVVVAVFVLYLLREVPLVKEFIQWIISIWQIPAAIGGLAFLVSGWILKHDFNHSKKTDSAKDDGIILLGLLDDVYQRLKLITRLTIRKMRSKKWENVTSAYPTLMGLADIDIEDAIETIMVKNVYLITTGKPMTIEEDGKKLATRIQQSSLFTRNPEHIAKDASIILREKVPYLKKKLDHDHTYKKLLKRIEHGRDKFPSEAVSNAIDEYLDHSIKINAAWVLSTYDLDHLGDIESVVGRRFPMKFKIILWGLPGRMDEEMRRYRNKVAIAIFESSKERTV